MWLASGWRDASQNPAGTFVFAETLDYLETITRKVDVRLPGKGIETPMARGRST